MNLTTAESDYQKLQVERQCFLDEAHRSAKVTIPALFPDNQDIVMRSTPVLLDKPFQSLGARGVNNLSSKLLLTLLPPTAPFMKYELSPLAREQAKEAGGAELTILKGKLARREQRIQAEVDTQGLRVKAYQVLRNLLVGGNCLVYKDPYEGGMQLFQLNSYVCKRDGRGNLLDLIYVEKMARASITDENVLKIISANPELMKPEAADTPVLLYTRVKLEKGKYRSWQEVGKQVVEGSEETHSMATMPWLVLRFTSVDGEDYGHGFVEEFRGDLTSFEQLSRDILFASANAAKVVWAVDPSSPTKASKFIAAPNGGAVSAKADDITAIRLDKGGDMAVGENQMARLERALSADFMLNSSFQREQERVTAEEIRKMAEELDDALGGVFSLLSQEFQLPLARLIEHGLVKSDPSFKALPDEAVRISVVTGLAAIGRGQDLMRLREGLALTAEIATFVPGIVDYLKEADLNERIWTGSGVDTEGLLYTSEEVDDIRAQRQQAAAQQTLGSELAKGAGKVAGTADLNAVIPGAAQAA